MSEEKMAKSDAGSVSEKICSEKPSPAVRRLRDMLSGNLFIALALLAAGLIVTLLIARYVKKNVESHARREFEFTCNEICLNISDRLAACAQILRSGAALFEASTDVTRAEWKAFTDRLRVEHHLPGIQGIGFSLLIPRNQLARHVQEICAQGFADYQVKPVGDRDVYTSIIYLEPFKDRNLRAFGYDMFSEPVRRAAMERARDENASALSGKVVLTQETDKNIQAGTLMYAPVYRHGMSCETVLQRREALLGWTFSPYRMTDLMHGTLRDWSLKQKDLHIYLQVYDGDTLSVDTLLYDSRSAEGEAAVSPVLFTLDTPVRFAGRRWTLSFTQFGSLASIAEYDRVLLVLSGGAVISLLIFVLAFLLLNMQANARRMAEQLTVELRDSEGMQRLLLDSLAEAVYGIDMSGNCTFCNNTCLRLLGHKSADELIGRNMHWQIHSKHSDGTPLPLEECRIFRAFHDGVGTHVDDEVLWRSDGASFPVEYWSYPIFREGIVIGAVVTFVDITERKLSEQQLKMLAGRLSLAVKAGGVGIWEYDIINNVLIWDDQMFALYGISKDKFGGAYEAWQSGLHPEDKARGDSEIRMAISGEKDFDTEFRVVWPDGTIRNIRAIAVVLRNGAGRPERMIGTNWDITVLKKTAEEAKIANIAKSEFLANMSHEIRTPLNGVIGFTELLVDAKLNAVQKQYAQNANTSAHALLGIINDILDFSKIEAGKLELESINTDIIELLEQTVDVVKFGATQKGLELLLDIPANVPRYATVDPLRTRQILINLASNAVKFTEKGEIEISVEFQPLPEEKNNTGKFTFSVRDTGIGISKANQGKLFKAFSQADMSTTRKFGGTGLGLVISNMIAEKMGGSIQMESETGKGSKFYFSIMTTFDKAELLPAVKIKDVKRALIVDDNESNRIILLHTLKNWHIEAECASNGLEALEKISKSEPFDVIIMDYNMPYMNGIETISMIRKNHALSSEKTPEILLHGSSDASSIYEECRRLGVHSRLIKPVKAGDLYRTLCSIKEPLEISGEDQASNIADDSLNLPGAVYASGKKILIVDDSAMNMNLSRVLVSSNVPTAEIIEAANGREAVDKFGECGPDIIFMDIQMPEMDGYTAAMEIRKIEKETGGHIPIIALTAGVVKGEREKCLASGMDAYLSKPIEVGLLKKVLGKYLLNAVEEAEGERFKADEFEKPAAEVKVFDHEKFLRNTDGQKEYMQCYISSFREHNENNMAEIFLAISENNPQKLKFSAHKFKGVMLGLGAMRISNILLALEDMGESGKMESSAALLEKLRAEVEIFKEEMKKYQL
ncbi:MAG TPA: CHASE domain-containing protein [Candidatus Wallbacteria bacterium]|nr:CHASE domain-containing protein [Candidatus Wallbacteria bacterium]